MHFLDYHKKQILKKKWYPKMVSDTDVGIPAGPVHPEKIETDFFAGRLPPSRDREAAADTFCSPCAYPEGETSGPGGLPDRRLVRMAGPDRGVIDQWLIPTGSCWRA